MFKKLDFAGNY